MADEEGTPGGPLDGVRVLEFSQIVAAPVCGVNLSDLGAEVIKVEPPGGEQTRRGGSVVPNESKGFQALNRGKLSLVVDLKEPRGRDVIHRLVPDIDVVVINYRLGVAQRIGIDYETLAAIRPDLIYWQNTGFGDEGPGAYRARSDIVSQAYSGLIAGDAKLDDDGAPDLITATALADYTTGFAAAMGISAALFHRGRTGEGQLLTTSLLRTGLFMQAGQVMREPVHDAVIRDPVLEEVLSVRDRGGSYGEILEARKKLRGLRAAFQLYYGGYSAKEGGLVLGALTDANRDGMRRVLGIEDEDSGEPEYDANDPANLEKAAEWKRIIREKIAARTVAEWVADFDAAGVPVAPVKLPEEMADDPQVLADGMIWELEHEVTGPQRVVGPAVKMSASPTAARKAAPALGADTDALLVDAGFGGEEIAALREAGVIA